MQGFVLQSRQELFAYLSSCRSRWRILFPGDRSMFSLDSGPGSRVRGCLPPHSSQGSSSAAQCKVTVTRSTVQIFHRNAPHQLLLSPGSFWNESNRINIDPAHSAVIICTLGCCKSAGAIHCNLHCGGLLRWSHFILGYWLSSWPGLETVDQPELR